MAGWGQTAQQRLKDAVVFVAGAGGLGSPVLLYLSAAGVGTLRISDDGAVEISNLNRQIVHSDARLGTNKALSAQQTLAQVNPSITVVPLTDRISAENTDRLIGRADVIVDCMDNFDTRYLLNEAALRLRIPLVFGAVWGMEGRISFLRPPQTACLRCLYPEGPPKETFPVVGAAPGVIGALQALETIKYLTGVGEPLTDKVLVWDGLTMAFHGYALRKDPSCSTCAVC
jgi:adenylyltransferase/sulfurtransferase